MSTNLGRNAVARTTHDSLLESLESEVLPLSDKGYFDHFKCPWMVTQGRQSRLTFRYSFLISDEK